MKKSDEYEYDLIYYDNKRLEQTDAYGYTRNESKQDYGYGQRDDGSRSGRQTSRARMSKKQSQKKKTVSGNCSGDPGSCSMWKNGNDRQD